MLEFQIQWIRGQGDGATAAAAETMFPAPKGTTDPELLAALDTWMWIVDEAQRREDAERARIATAIERQNEEARQERQRWAEISARRREQARIRSDRRAEIRRLRERREQRRAEEDSDSATESSDDGSEAARRSRRHSTRGLQTDVREISRPLATGLSEAVREFLNHSIRPISEEVQALPSIEERQVEILDEIRRMRAEQLRLHEDVRHVKSEIQDLSRQVNRLINCVLENRAEPGTERSGNIIKQEPQQ